MAEPSHQSSGAGRHARGDRWQATKFPKVLHASGTDELIAEYQLQEADLSAADVADAIAVAIDAMYEVRDSGGNMHDAGAAAAIAVLKVLVLHG